MVLYCGGVVMGSVVCAVCGGVLCECLISLCCCVVAFGVVL